MYKVAVKPTDYGYPEGSNDWNTRWLFQSNRRGHRAGHAHRRISSKLARSVKLLTGQMVSRVCHQKQTPGELRLSARAVSDKNKGYCVKVSAARENQSQRDGIAEVIVYP